MAGVGPRAIPLADAPRPKTRHPKTHRVTSPPADRLAMPPAPTAAPYARGLRNGLLLGVMALALLLLVAGGELGGFGGVLVGLPLALAASLAAHLPQIGFTALAWQVLLPPPRAVGLRDLLALRWYREAADSLLPAGGLVGQAAVARLLARRGVPADLAAASATIGLMLEAVSQLLFTLAGLVLLLALGAATGHLEFGLGLAFATLSAGAMLALQHDRVLSLLRGLLARLARRWPRLDPAWADRLREALRRLHADRRGLLVATLLHLGAWLMGAVELMVVLHLLGHPIGLAEAIVIESLAQILRNAGLLLPGAAGVQEGATVAAAALFGVPAGAALSAALVRRTREVVLVGLPGLVAWRRAELASAPLPPLSAVSEHPRTTP